MNVSEINNSVAIVTGANRGIGLEISRGLAQRDIEVVLTSRDEKKGLEAIDRLRSEGLAVHYHQLEVTDPTSIQDLYGYIQESFPSLDILVNNAGILVDRRSDIFTVDMEVVRQTMETNLYGPLQLTQALLPLMRMNGYGRIVNVSSGLGQFGALGTGSPSYRLSKAGLNALTVMMAAGLRGTDVLVNAVSPGWVRTDMGGPSASRSVEQGADTAIWLSTLPTGGPQGGFFHDRERIEW